MADGDMDLDDDVLMVSTGSDTRSETGGTTSTTIAEKTDSTSEVNVFRKRSAVWAFFSIMDSNVSWNIL